MRGVGGLSAVLFLVAAVVVSAPGRAADIPFVRTVIARDSPHCPCGKALGDLNGDGRLDAIVAGSEGPLVWYASPGWTRSVLAAQGTTTEGGLAVGDLDRDGDLDVTVGTVWFENPRRPGQPPTAPWPAHQIGSGSGNREVAIGDLDRDGKPDIVLRGETGVVTLFRQRGSGAWLRRDLAPGVGTQGLALADLDRDRFLDIVVGGRWLRNPRGKILSQPWQRRSFASWSPEAALDIGDLNRDGRPDIVMTVSEGAGRISWFENPANPGRPRWKERVIDRGPLDSAQGVSLADLDRDGDLDVVTSEIRGEGRLLVYLNAGNASRWSRQILGTPALHDVRVSDVGGDGDGDILGTVPFGKGPVELWENRLEPEPPAGPDRILVFSRTTGFRHSSIEPGIAALRNLGAANDFAVDATEEAGQFTTANLRRYKAVVFLSTTGDVLNGEQQAAFMTYIRRGGGFVGIHAAADTEHGWPWYGGLVGAYFKSHPEPAQARIRVENRDHPSTRTLPDPWNRFDEWYDFQQNPRSQGVTVLLTLDESSYSGGQMGNDHPIAWYHEYEGGRAWYTAGGHTDASFSEPAFLEHLLGGIRYAAGAR
jgi:type 1 glutamine amidotransferase